MYSQLVVNFTVFHYNREVRSKGNGYDKNEEDDSSYSD
ncbi:Uncharacterised protein [Streptococcus acidominimus]|uniref:Uncharacterized protein n=1 Tax=Streptococcus acidominimus TaxID=1326 RepID=A0A380IC69_STRAI|nr:Uncharacterised protein [Streptococcus acidominimus]